MESRKEKIITTIGIDLGGTNTSLGLVDNEGRILSKINFPTNLPTPADWSKRVWEEIDILCKKHNNITVKGIGIGAPCANNKTGVIEGATDLPWESPFSLVELFGRFTDIPVSVTNDANAAAIGEMIYGEAKGLHNFIVLTLGTGVGAGVVVDGHLLNGNHGFAGELGHITFPFAQERACGCGRKGCLQTVASAKGIVRTALDLLSQSAEPSVLREIPGEKLSSHDIAKAAENGDKLARDVFEFTGKCLGKAAAEFAAFTDPEAIILFGGVAKAGKLLLDPMTKAFHENALFLYDKVKILISTLPESDSAVLGAASLPYLKDNCN